QCRHCTYTFSNKVSNKGRTVVNSINNKSRRCQEAKTAAEFIAGNREVARYVEKYKGRFLGAAVVNPLFIDESLREIEDCRKQLGFVWVGELCKLPGSVRVHHQRVRTAGGADGQDEHGAGCPHRSRGDGVHHPAMSARDNR